VRTPAPSGRPARRRPRGLVAATVVAAAAALAAGGCSGGSSAARSPAAGSAAGPSAAGPSAASGRAVSPAARRRGGFTVRGVVPVAPNASQDTHAAGTSCQPLLFRHDQNLGLVTELGFGSAGATASAQLLSHFLAGTGTAVRFGAGSRISRLARASGPFRQLNRQVQAIVGRRLRAGRADIRLPRAVLPLIRFGRPGSAQDLYLGFRGTQGLDVRGAGTRTARGYAGTLTYVIRDSYGFPPRDVLLGIGSAMRYLQTDCGRPPTSGGAHWFPDSITVTVPVRVPAR
jgi:hypothetical protein